MVCYALLGKTRGKMSTATASENFRCGNTGGEVLSTPPLQPSSGLFQVAVLVCPDAGVQIELSKVVTHRQRQWGFLAERALSYSCFNLFYSKPFIRIKALQKVVTNRFKLDVLVNQPESSITISLKFMLVNVYPVLLSLHITTSKIISLLDPSHYNTPATY